jgi:hypothetical protein
MIPARIRTLVREETARRVDVFGPNGRLVESGELGELVVKQPWVGQTRANVAGEVGWPGRG